MDSSWKDHEPSPIEFMHGRMIDLFHEYRKQNGISDLKVLMGGSEIAELARKARLEVYEKYKKLNLDKAVLKSSL